MRRNTKTRVFVAFIVVAAFFAFGLWLIFSQMMPDFMSSITPESKVKEIADKRATQYRFAYDVKGDKTQIIHLNQGPALFEMYHESAGPFRVDLKTPQDSLIVILSDTSGKFEKVKEIQVPFTGAYLLTVKTPGTWGLNFR